MKYLLIISVVINLWFQFNDDVYSGYYQKKCGDAGFSYGETYLLKIRKDIQCANKGDK